MGFYPLPLPGYDRKPESRGRLLLNENSSYRRGLVFDWVGGDTQCFDNAGSAVIRPDAVKPTKSATREGLVSSFADGDLAALLVSGPTMIDLSKPWSIACRLSYEPGIFSYCGQLSTTGNSALQITASDTSSVSGGLAVTSNDTSDLPRMRSGLGTLPAGEQTVAVVTFNGANKSVLANYDFYIGGTHHPAIASGARGATPNETRIGRTDAAGRDFIGDWAGLRVWRNRRLEPALAVELSRRYWAPGGQPISYRADCPRYFFVPEAGQGSLIRSVPEILQAAEAQLRALKLNRVEAANLSVPEAAASPRGLIRRLPETASVIEGLFGSRAMSRQRGETLQPSEVALLAKGLVRLVVDALQLAEARDRVLGFARSVSQTLQLAEAAQSILGFVRSVLEMLDLSESRVKFLGLVRAATEFLQTAEAIVRTRSLARSVTATIQANETLFPVRLLVRHRNNLLQVIEAAFSGRALLRLHGETAGLEEASVIARGFAQVLGETLSLTELALSSTVKGVVAVLCGSVSILAAVGGALFKKTSGTGGVSIKASSGGQPDAPECYEKTES